MSGMRIPGGKSIKTSVLVLSLVALIMLILPFTPVSIYYIQILIGVFLYVIMTASLRMVSLSGQISLGHAGLMCAGAYTSAIISRNLEWSPWITIPIGALLSFALALLVAIPFSRLRGLYFTMISLFFGLAVIAVNQVFERITGGQSGISGIPTLFNIPSKTPYYFFNFAIMAVCLFILWRLENSRTGLTWKAVAQSHSVASSTGIDEVRQRIICFGIGGLFAGLAGAVYTHTVATVLSITNFNFFSSIYIFIYMMAGGVNSFWGPALGATAILLVQAFARSLKEYVPFIPAGVLLIVLFLMPEGLISFPQRIKVLYNKLRTNSRISVASGEDRNAP